MEKSFGIKITLPSGDTMALSHLLGERWESFRWFESAALRDRIYTQMKSQPDNYREGDNASVKLEKIDPKSDS